VRAVHAGALAVLDEAIGNISSAIIAAGLWEDTLIFFSSDNGGPLGSEGDGTMASNFPFRGGKHTLYEGGVRAEAFAWGPKWFGAPGGNAIWGGLAHVSDVGLTILDAAGVAPLPPRPGRELHGVSFWGPLTAGAPANRSHVVVNIDYTTANGDSAQLENYAQAALVAANGWKLLLGNPAFPELDYWSDRNGERGPPPGPSSVPLAPSRSAGEAAPSPLWPLANMTPSLYNLTADPREAANVAGDHPDVVAEMLQVLAAWGVRAVPVVENNTVDPQSNPGKYFNGSWTPWLGL
jgi:arylsulfatase B